MMRDATPQSCEKDLPANHRSSRDRCKNWQPTHQLPSTDDGRWASNNEPKNLSTENCIMEFEIPPVDAADLVAEGEVDSEGLRMLEELVKNCASSVETGSNRDLPANFRKIERADSSANEEMGYPGTAESGIEDPGSHRPAPNNNNHELATRGRDGNEGLETELAGQKHSSSSAKPPLPLMASPSPSSASSISSRSSSELSIASHHSAPPSPSPLSALDMEMEIFENGSGSSCGLGGKEDELTPVKTNDNSRNPKLEDSGIHTVSEDPRVDVNSNPRPGAALRGSPVLVDDDLPKNFKRLRFRANEEEPYSKLETPETDFDLSRRGARQCGGEPTAFAGNFDASFADSDDEWIPYSKFAAMEKQLGTGRVRCGHQHRPDRRTSDVHCVTIEEEPVSELGHHGVQKQQHRRPRCRPNRVQDGWGREATDHHCADERAAVSKSVGPTAANYHAADPMGRAQRLRLQCRQQRRDPPAPPAQLGAASTSSRAPRRHQTTAPTATASTPADKTTNKDEKVEQRTKRLDAANNQASPWMHASSSNYYSNGMNGGTSSTATLAADQPPASLPPMTAYDRRLGSPVMPRKPKRVLDRAKTANSANLQICFMPDAALDSDDERQQQQQHRRTSPATDPSTSRLSAAAAEVVDRRIPAPVMPPKSLPATSIQFSGGRKYSAESTTAASAGNNNRQKSVDDSTQEDFWRKQARLQAEARVALAQACHMAKMQMEVERQRKKNSPISEMILLPKSCSGHRRLSRTLLSRISVSELNAIHSSLIKEVKKLNEDLVTNLMMRDELHMEQDSMLVDLEDLTRYLSAKEDILRVRGPQFQQMVANNNNNNNSTGTSKQTETTGSNTLTKHSRFSSLKSLVKF